MNVLTEIRERREDSYKILDDTSSLPDVDVLESAQSRRRTDAIFLYVFAACIILLMPFLIYTLWHSDINRLTKGYDACGNICGQKNIKYDEWNCTGQDHTLKPVHVYGECTDDASFSQPWARVSSTAKLKFFKRAEWKIVLVSFVPLAICLIFIILFRYVPAVAVWSILVVFWLVFTAAVLLFLFMSYFLWQETLVIIICIMLTLLLFSLILFKLKYIRLTTLLLKEATRALFEIKMMCFVPIGALFVLIVTLAVYVTIAFHIGTAGKLTQRWSGYFLYLPDKIMVTTIILNSIIAFWAFLVIFGAQTMTVSRAIGQWYSTRNQENIKDTVASSLLVTVKYHMGTVVLGSVLMTIMFVPRAVLQILKTFSEMNEKADSWLRSLDGFFTNNLYIMTATKGTSFIQSGKQASKLLKLSIGNTRDLNLYVNLIITLGQSITIFVSGLGSYITLYYEVGFYGPYSELFTLIQLGIACCCAFTFLETLRVSANTIFFCATENLLRNKDADLPFTMTMEEILDGSNKLFLQKVQNRPASNILEKSFYIKMFLFLFVGVSCVLFFVAYFI